MRYRVWSRSCATVRKLTGSIPNLILPAAIWPYVQLSLNRNGYHGYFIEGKGSQCVGLTNLSPSCADCLEILGASTSWNPRALSRSAQGLLASNCVAIIATRYGLHGPRFEAEQWQEIFSSPKCLNRLWGQTRGTGVHSQR
jgi:hypothetical protein